MDIRPRVPAQACTPRRATVLPWVGVGIGLVAILAFDGRIGATPQAATTAATEAEARITCGVTCHKFPPPDILPRAAWRDEIRLMAQLRDDRSRASAAPSQSLSPPLPEDMKRALQYYERTAPARLAPPEAWPAVDDARTATVKFTKHVFAPEGAPATPAVSNVRFADLDGDSRLEALGTDMRHGLVFLLRPYAPTEPMRLVAQVPAPSHVALVDLDRDGLSDLLVSDLGEFSPGDHLKGAAIWLRGVLMPDASGDAAPRSPDDATGARSGVDAHGAGGASASDASIARRAPRVGHIAFKPLIIGHLPRVADVEAADLDEDGQMDLAVAAFGWRQVGQLMWLRRANSTFTPITLDPRPGAIHVIPIDINRDGHIDLVSVIAQEHEEVAALLNDGHGNFEKKSIYEAPHPNWGSSGIEVVDLDRDGDLDVLLAHGDMFDDLIIKPYHGIQWLENRGIFPFTPHTLCSLPGVHRAIATDLDHDGDLDIVASALVPEGAGARTLADLPSIVWLEQTSPGVFIRHTLERGTPRHPTIAAADYDDDGDVDLLVGNMVATTESRAWVEVWENVSAARIPRLPGHR
jgi:hypothetical protein